MDFHALQTRLLNEVRARVRNGEMTERSLARLSGISQPHIHNALKGVRSLSLESTDRLLRRLRIDVADLVAGEAGLKRDAAPARDVSWCMVPLLDGLIGPGHPYPATEGRAVYAFPSADLIGLLDPVAVRLAPQPLGPTLFDGDAVALLDRATERQFDPAEEGYFALDLRGRSAIALARPGLGLCLWSAKSTWDPAGFPDHKAADLIRGRLKLVLRHL